MFGVLRTILAVMVMIFHLFADMAPLGKYAVFGFYIISGYLMTLIMHETYGYTWYGKYSFAINRALRLYPQYWAAALFSGALVLALGSQATTSYHESIYIPITLGEAVSNLTMIFPSWNPGDIHPRLVPPTWALTIEMFFYWLICLGISQTFRRVRIWFLLSVCYVIGSFVMGLSWEDRYFPAAAASLPFSMGSATYFLSKRSEVKHFYSELRLSSLSLFCLFLANCLFWMILNKSVQSTFLELGLYVSMTLFVCLICNIAIGNDIWKINHKLDKFIGDLSYPIYLLHWQCGLLISCVIFGKPFHGFSGKGFLVLIGSAFAVVVISIVFVRVIDVPIQRIRARIKVDPGFRQRLSPLASDH
jgi:peptidoglycan/LPS O-acetylase OafA/YrhL